MNQSDPAWRNQYAGGLKPDPDVEAALAGSAPMSFKPAAPSWAIQDVPSQFGAFVKLR